MKRLNWISYTFVRYENIDVCGNKYNTVVIY